VKAQQELSLEIARGFDWQALEEPQLSADRSQYQAEFIVGTSSGIDAGAAFCEMTDDSILYLWGVGEAGCPAPARNDPRVGSGQSQWADHQLAFRQAASHGTLDDSSTGHHLGIAGSDL